MGTAKECFDVAGLTLKAAIPTQLPINSTHASVLFGPIMDEIRVGSGS